MICEKFCTWRQLTNVAGVIPFGPGFEGFEGSVGPIGRLSCLACLAVEETVFRVGSAGPADRNGKPSISNANGMALEKTPAGKNAALLTIHDSSASPAGNTSICFAAERLQRGFFLRQIDGDAGLLHVNLEIT